MSGRSLKAHEILDAAEQMVRRGGYNGFSYREIAKRVGIKAASVHYHFPGKGDLGAAVARRYTDRFLTALGEANDPDEEPSELLQRYVGAYRRGLIDEGLMCLCGMLGAEVAALPEPVASEAKRFFERNIEWLTQLFRRNDSEAKSEGSRIHALRIIATLEGAMILARTLGDQSVFDDIASGVPLASQTQAKKLM